MRSLVLLAAGMAGFGFLVAVPAPANAYVRTSPAADPIRLEPIDTIIKVEKKAVKPALWVPPAAAGPYLVDVAKAETKYGLPKQLLARVLYQESRYRQDIITGQLKSSAGAVGIAQIVPKWHPNVNPLDPVESIYYAASYLNTLFKQFGSWDLALAAYNWGPGNVSKYGLAKAPKETRDYYSQILADVEV